MDQVQSGVGEVDILATVVEVVVHIRFGWELDESTVDGSCTLGLVGSTVLWEMVVVHFRKCSGPSEGVLAVL